MGVENPDIKICFSGVARGVQKEQLPPPPFFKENALGVEQSVTS